MRVARTHSTHPTLPESQRQQRNPVDVQNVKRTDLYRAAGVLARETVIVAECEGAWPKMINPVNNQHVSRSLWSAPHANISPIRGLLPKPGLIITIRAGCPITYDMGILRQLGTLIAFGCRPKSHQSKQQKSVVADVYRKGCSAESTDVAKESRIISVNR